ncbi:MAG: FAD-binding protein [Deltaproteobacteria bacterium]|nr:FAD-binding protein [Deltaproteobacteria bacterium]MBW1922334.1 FAD-binding protein [Deltaproteobacteria bacterium]MBW1948086.1 FAD-binding protein [Deltaproteobacteria bacterium]MBW2006511.1 FAD-binding protein [Deltaproteobacteria bacterium]MBW2101243.1 FAD-binding protein [Deltaproteobacteria bacterium]
MISQSALRELARIVGPDHLVTDRTALGEYGTDGTKLAFPPDAAAFPRDAEQISRILRVANREGFPVIPRGAGSGMSGGALPVRGGLVLGLRRLDRILEIDRENLVAKVEPGVITADLQEAAEQVGLFYPPDPASIHISTIGGNVAECAGGLRAVKYGVTKDYVLGLTVVLPTGKILKTGVETMKGVAGYDLTRLIVGSEGTLAVITRITLRLIPRPDAKETMLAFFRDVEEAVETVSSIIGAGVTPTALEFLDGLCLRCVKKEMGLRLPAGAGAMLLIEVDGTRRAVTDEAEKIRHVCLHRGALNFREASDPREAETLWEARRNVSPSLYRLRPHKTSEDVVVPRSLLPALARHLDGLARRFGLPIAAFGHAGDGNLHVNIMYDGDDPVERDKVDAVVRELFMEVIRLGGTISGEHGIGITKAPYLEMEIPEEGIRLMGRIKKAFDPNGILNPGKIFPPAGADPDQQGVQKRGERR